MSPRKEAPAREGHRADADEPSRPTPGRARSDPQRPSSTGHKSDADERTEATVDRKHRQDL